MAGSGSATPSALASLPADLLAEGAVDLGQRPRELLRVGIEKLVHVRQGDAGLAEGPDANEVDDCARAVPPVSGCITVGLGKEAALVVVAHRSHGDPGKCGHLSDRQRRSGAGRHGVSVSVPECRGGAK